MVIVIIATMLLSYAIVIIVIALKKEDKIYANRNSFSEILFIDARYA